MQVIEAGMDRKHTPFCGAPGKLLGEAIRNIFQLVTRNGDFALQRMDRQPTTAQNLKPGGSSVGPLQTGTVIPHKDLKDSYCMGPYQPGWSQTVPKPG